MKIYIFAPTEFLLPIPIFNFGGVYWTKFECISGKIRRILTNDTCASAALDKLARGKTQKFPIIFYCGSPHTPRREAENLKGRKFLVLLSPLHSSKKAYKSYQFISKAHRLLFLTLGRFSQWWQAWDCPYPLQYYSFEHDQARPRDKCRLATFPFARVCAWCFFLV